MYPHVLLGVLLLFATTTASAQAPSAAERELIKLENEWVNAVQKKDMAFLQKLYADEYLFTDEEGQTYTKAQDIAQITSGEFTMTSSTLSDLKVHVYGDTAVVTGANTMKATLKGKPADGTIRFTDVFVKRQGAWQVVASHGSRVAKH